MSSHHRSRVLAAALLLLAARVLPAQNDADLDPTFAAGDGIARFDISGAGSADRVFAAERLSDGRTLLLAQIDAEDGLGDLAIVRLLADGRRDPDFGSNGQQWHSLGGNGSALGSAMAADGRLLVAGSLAGPGGEQRGAVWRFHPDGPLDVGFETVTSLAMLAARPIADVAVGDDGRIFAVTTAGGVDATDDAAIVALRPDGSIDTSFGAEGMVRIDFGFEQSPSTSQDRGRAIVVDALGRLVVAGESVGPQRAHFFAFRLKPDGALDETFGKRGRMLVAFDTCSDATAVETVQLRVLLPLRGGRVALAGSAGNEGCLDSDRSGFALAVLARRGDPDRSFAGNGRLLLKFSPAALGANRLGGLAEDIRGRLVLAGEAGRVQDRTLGTVVAAARVEPDGRLDPGFGVDGMQLYAVDAIDAPDRAAAVVMHGARTLLLGTSIGAGEDVTALRLVAEPLIADGFE